MPPISSSDAWYCGWDSCTAPVTSDRMARIPNVVSEIRWLVSRLIEAAKNRTPAWRTRSWVSSLPSRRGPVTKSACPGRVGFLGGGVGAAIRDHDRLGLQAAHLSGQVLHHRADRALFVVGRDDQRDRRELAHPVAVLLGHDGQRGVIDRDVLCTRVSIGRAHRAPSVTSARVGSKSGHTVAMPFSRSYVGE